MGSGGSKHKQARAFQASERPSPPGKPFVVPQSPGADQDVITIKWDPPIYGGGSKIIGYLVEHKRTVSPHWVKATPILVKHHQLSLSGLEPGMRYQFRVFAENSGGKSDSSPLSEPIAISHQRGVAIAPVFLRTLRDTTAIENEKVEFTVKVDGTPFPRISWYKDGFEVFSNRRQRVSTDEDISTFVIHQAALSDEGEIKCCATNKAGHAVAKATLTLQAPPTIRLPRQYEDGILFELGESVKLKVSISGRPQPEVTWYHNGKPIESGNRVECTTTDKYSMLRVSNGTREDRGEYQVKAVNPLGEDTASLLVTITDRPLPPGKVNVVMTLGRCVTLAWTIPYDDGGCKIGNYIVEYFRIGWNMWLKAATCRQLTTTIGDLIEGSEYKFRVKAENPYGISDPSEESDIIFIPDPKRGLLEPPPRGTQKLLDEIPEQWLGTRDRTPERKFPPKEGKSREDWIDDDSPIPSPVILANQVLQKVKMAPKRGWSEDSQGSPPRETLPLPVPPRRKHRITTSFQDKPSPVPEESHLEEKKPIRRWEKELSPRSNMDDDIQSSSEMMLVLLPNKDRGSNDGQGTTNTLTAGDFDSEANVAPPMSLSAPELSSCEPFDFQELRLSASSSEIMHELALIRFNKEASEEEAEINLRTRFGIERRRSFERRPSKTRDNFSSSKENLPSPDQLLAKRKELMADFDSKRAKRLSDSSDEMEERENRVEQFSERFLNLERSFKEYAALTNMKLMEDDESDRMSSIYSEDEYFEEETYHPRSMIPNNINAVSSQEPFGSPILHKPPMVTINEEPEPIKFESPESKRKQLLKNRSRLTPERILRRSLTPERETISFRRSQTPSPGESRTPSTGRSRSPSPNIVIDTSPQILEKHEPPSLPITPKPILKVRDKSVERLDASQLSLNKKVRIELPDEKEPQKEDEEKEPQKKAEESDKSDINIFVQKENDIGIAAGEVARNRRKKLPPPVDPATKVIIDHYSDIVREYGQAKKPAPKLYLSYDELKAAAERSAQEKPEEPEVSNTITNLNQENQERNSNSSNTENQEESAGAINIPPRTVIVNPRSKLYLEYLLDVFLFLVACWFYFFKDVRLTIPILLLMAYRQLNEAALKIIRYKPFGKKK